jgi:NAD(P)-dependent dehydrogenase (short-subunit alcohol dehydrogenase family)
MTASLNGRVALVTGAANGIGRATALAFAAAGADVLLADRDAEGGEKAAAEVEAAGVKARFVQIDVADAAQVEAMVATAVDDLGGLDMAFNNAGIEPTSAPLADGTRDDWDRIIAVDLTAVWLCMQAEIPHLLKRGGAIVNCSSIAGLVGFPGAAPYVAAKHGVVGLTKTAALDYAEQGLRVNAVCPGVIDTPMIQRFTHGDPEATQALTASEPVQRLGRPEEIAAAVVWLCSDEASFVTGQAIAVDGGYVAR